MKKQIKFLLLSLILLMTSMVSAAYEIKGASVNWLSDYKGTAGLEFKMEEGWHIFWEHPGAVGVSTEVTLTQAGSSEKLSNIWPAPQSFMVGPLEGWGYEDYVIIPMVFPNNMDPYLPYKLDITGQICKEVCIPFEISDDIMPNGQNLDTDAQKLTQAASNIPLPAASDIQAHGVFEMDVTNADKALLEITVSNPNGFKNPKIFESSRRNLGYTSKDVFLQDNNKTAIFILETSGLKFEPDALTQGELKLTIVDGKSSYYLSATAKKGIVKAKKTPPLSLIIIAQALLVGLIFNIMPCVLPVLGIKLGSIVGLAGAEKTEVRLRFMLTALGILIAFIALAVMIASAKLLGVYMGWGTHFQQPLFIIAMIFIVSIFAASLFGLWTLMQPSVTTKTTKTSLLSEVGSGILATILATPCTVPFMAPVAAFAFAGSLLQLFIIFLCIGLGMALPWLLVALFPQAVSLLPKPGMWMVYVKRFFGILLLATNIWLLWVLHNQITMLAWLAVILAILLIFTVFIITRHSLSTLKWLWILLIAAATLAMAAFMPIAKDNSSLQEGQKGALAFENFSYQRLTEVLQNGQQALVIGTADWCITCKVNERRVFSHEKVAKRIKEHDIIVLLADMTNDNPEGKKWMQELDRYGLPLTVFYRSLTDFDILPTFLSEKDIFDRLK
ncbi:MAG: protein-disulfide reductase DsbD domain-containing protein [Alphaproteobacteria bacterium]